MTDEYGPPIHVNGKRPEWLADNDRFQWQDAKQSLDWGIEPYDTTAKGFCWDKNVVTLQLPADHPYYQSAEYKASVGEADVPGREQRLSEYAQALEAAGYTVTPPDPLAAEREFLAAFNEASGFNGTATQIRHHAYDAMIPAAMEYLRANKGRL